MIALHKKLVTVRQMFSADPAPGKPGRLSGTSAVSPFALRGVLAHDPRPSYQSDPERLYGVAFAEKNVRFTVRDGVLTVREIEPLKEE